MRAVGWGVVTSRSCRICSILALNSSVGGLICGGDMEEKSGRPPGGAPPPMPIIPGPPGIASRGISPDEDKFGKGLVTSTSLFTNSKFFGIVSIWASEPLRNEYESEKLAPIS